MRAVVAALVLGLAWSGCTQGSEDALDAALPTDATMGTTDAAEPTWFNPDGTVDVPIWHVGDWWHYNVKYSSGETYDAKIVVSDDTGNYEITSDSRELLLRAAFTHYPTFGKVNQATLNHQIHGIDVPFLKFPMQNQTWEAQYRDFTATFTSTYGTLPTGKGAVPGFTTTMVNAADGNVRLVQGWSPVTKYFTSFNWDFDGVAPNDVEFTLQDWGTGFTGTIPVLEITDGVHRVFPTFALAPPNPASPPPVAAPEARESFTLSEGQILIWGLFAVVGGPADFEIHLVESGSGQQTHYSPWRPTAATSHFEWHEIADAPPGQWDIIGTGTAQNSAFLFLETYGVKTTQVET